MKAVYVETTIFSYLVARPSRDLLASARQQVTGRWWHDHRSRFELFVSLSVKREAARGDRDVAERRLAAMAGIPVLVLNEAATSLAVRLIEEQAVPREAPEDALHVALAAVHGIDYLLTWNFRHIDNAEKRPAIRSVCAIEGFPCPEICTPEELMGELSNE